MTTPAQVDLRIDAGVTLRKEIEWKDSDGTPVDLTGYRVMFQVRSFATSASTVLSFDSDNLTTGQTIDPLDSSGVISFEIADEQTSALPEGIHFWDLVVESPSGERDKLVYGQAFVYATATRIA